MISDNGWDTHCIWEHSQVVHDLYARRCRLEAEEMTCAAQAAELLSSRIQPGDTVLDVGCGSGYFFHSLKNRGIPVEYYGIDAAPTLIEIGQRYLPEHGLPADRLKCIRIEDLGGTIDHVICMNVLSNIDNYHRPLERILSLAQKSVILRESLSEFTEYNYVKDKYLDADVDLSVHVNTYSRFEIANFMEQRGFDPHFVVDQRTGGQPEMVIDYPHYWQFLEARRVALAIQEAA